MTKNSFDPSMFELRPEDLDRLRKRSESMRRHHTYTPTHMVSTVDLLVEHFGGMWAETMVFAIDKDGHPTNWSEEDSERYHTFDEAMADHARFVEKYGGEVRTEDSVGGVVTNKSKK